MTYQRKPRKHRRRTTIGGQFAARLIEMLESPAFQVLSLSARRVLNRIEIELAHHGGADNGRLPVTFDDFERYSIDRHAIAPAVRELEALGFIEITERGQAGNAEFRTPNKFRLTYRDTEHAAPTHEWRRIGTVEHAQMMAREARKVWNLVGRGRASKHNSNGGKYQFSVGRTPTENIGCPVGETPTTAVVEKSPLLSISGG